MPVIDAHVHLYPPEVGREPAAWAAAHGEGHWATLCARRRKDGSAVQLFPTVAELLGDMDTAGVEKSVLLGWYWEKPETCARQNRFYAACVRAHPDRLAAFATIHPDAGAAALDEIRRAKDDGLIGLGELSPHSQHVAIDGPAWREVLVLAGELGLPVNLHVTDPDSAPYPGRVETPLEDFVRLAHEFPRTSFVLAHWGGGLAFEPASRELRNVHFDSAASPLMYGREVWSRAATAVGADRLLFGSDNPLRLFPKTEAGVGLASFACEAKAALAQEDVAAVLGGNARRVLGMQ
jgi:predicted TIM-barrel fold metal-dependent hydrolase